MIPKNAVGLTVHVLRPISIPLADTMSAPVVSLDYGDVQFLDTAALDATRDKSGFSALIANLDNPEAAVQRGPWPAHLPRVLPGSPRHQEMREAARQTAWRIEDPEARAAALAEVVRTYGPGPTTSRTLMRISA